MAWLRTVLNWLYDQLVYPVITSAATSGHYKRSAERFYGPVD